MEACTPLPSKTNPRFSLSAIIFLHSCKIIFFPGPTHSKVVVCYIATWAVYRPGKGSYSIENFDPSLCTHVVYAFAGLNATTHDSIVSLGKYSFSFSLTVF